MPTHNYMPPEEENFSSSPINLSNVFHTLIERAWVIVLCLGAALLLTALWLKNATRTYTAKAVIQVENDRSRISPIESVHAENPNTVDFVKTVEQTLQNRNLYARVIQANKLDSDPRFIDPEDQKPSVSSLVSRLAGMVEVKLRPGTRLIDIYAEHTNPELAALVANSLAEEYIKTSKEEQASDSEYATGLLLNEVKRLEKQLQASESALQEYREKMKFLPSPNDQNIMVESVKEQLSQAKSRRIDLESEYRQFENSKTNLNALLSIPTIANNANIIQLKNQVMAKQTEVVMVEQRYRHKHPAYLQVHSQLSELTNSLQEAIMQAGQTLRVAHANAKTAEKELQSTLEKEEAAAIELSRTAMNYRQLATQAESDRTLYQSFLNRMKETSVIKDLGTSKVRIRDHAYIPDSPSNPQVTKVALLGTVAGLVVGLGLAFFLGVMDSSLKSLDEAEEYLRMPTLSTVPQLPSGQLDSSQLVMGQNSVMSGAESFRSLRTSLSLINTKGDHRIYLFTSAMPEEGKTFCSMNYAYSLAQQGLRVLLIDCDLRRPAVEQCLCGSQGKMSGVSDYLNARQTFTDIVYDTGIPNFYFIPAGSPVGNPSELLTQERFNALIQEGLSHFDRIVLDSAPIFGVSDTLLVTSRAHVACLVVRACKTPRKKVLRAIQILQNAGAPLVGMVLNRLPANDRRNSNDPYYDYGYANERNANIVPLLPATSNTSSPGQEAVATTSDAQSQIPASRTS